jgi:hypothetical protein
MVPLELTKLTALMDRTSGSPDVKIGLIDGPVMIQHPDLVGEHLHGIQEITVPRAQANSMACLQDLCNRHPNCKRFSRPPFAPTVLSSSDNFRRALGGERMPGTAPGLRRRSSNM